MAGHRALLYTFAKLCFLTDARTELNLIYNEAQKRLLYCLSRLLLLKTARLHGPILNLLY